MNCCICSSQIKPDPISGWDQGNNAEPVKDGRCCDWCNMHVVVPARIKDYIKWEKEHYGLSGIEAN